MRWTLVLDLHQKVLVAVMTLTKISILSRKEKKEKEKKKSSKRTEIIGCLSHSVVVEMKAGRAQMTDISVSFNIVCSLEPNEESLCHRYPDTTSTTTNVTT
jgi:hypothetical protein